MIWTKHYENWKICVKVFDFEIGIYDCEELWVTAAVAIIMIMLNIFIVVHKKEDKKRDFIFFSLIALIDDYHSH